MTCANTLSKAQAQSKRSSTSYGGPTTGRGSVPPTTSSRGSEPPHIWQGRIQGKSVPQNGFQGSVGGGRSTNYLCQVGTAATTPVSFSFEFPTNRDIGLSRTTAIPERGKALSHMRLELCIQAAATDDGEVRRRSLVHSSQYSLKTGSSFASNVQRSSSTESNIRIAGELAVIRPNRLPVRAYSSRNVFTHKYQNKASRLLTALHVSSAGKHASIPVNAPSFVRRFAATSQIRMHRLSWKCHGATKDSGKVRSSSWSTSDSAQRKASDEPLHEKLSRREPRQGQEDL